MYNGIGLTTPRGSGTNGFVIRNLSAVRKTKEKVRDYKEKEDLAVRPFDIELIEHERRRQAEVRCLELQELLEEKNIPEDEIQEKVSAFRAKLLAEKKSGPRDASGRPILRDSHELAMAQEEKNEKAKSAFGISDDFVPGSSYDRSKVVEKDKTLTPVPTLEIAKKDSSKPVEESKVEKEKMKKRKKSHKRKASSSSSSSSSSEEESRRKKRRKEKKKKSKKSHSHHHHKRKNRSPSHEKFRNSVECACVASLSPSSSSNHTNACFNHNSSSEDCSDIPTKIQLSSSSCVAIVDLAPSSNSNTRRDSLKSNSKSPIEISLPLKFSSSNNNNNTNTNCHGHSPPGSSHSVCTVSPITTTATLVLNEIRNNYGTQRTGMYDFSRSNSRSSSGRSSKSNSRSPSRFRSKSRSLTSDWKSKSRSRSHTRSRSRSRSESRSPRSSRSSESRSGRSRSHSRSHSGSRSRKTRRSISGDSNHGRSSRSHSHSKSRSRSVSSKSSRSLSIPRRRGSPSFLDRRRITSARKRPIPYKRRQGSEWENSSDSSDSSD